MVEHFKSRVLVKLKELIHVTQCSNHASVAKLMVSETTALLPKFHYAMILVTYFILSRYDQWNVFQCFLPCLTKHFVFSKVFLKPILNFSCFIINTMKIYAKCFSFPKKRQLGMSRYVSETSACNEIFITSILLKEKIGQISFLLTIVHTWYLSRAPQAALV